MATAERTKKNTPVGREYRFYLPAQGGVRHQPGPSTLKYRVHVAGQWIGYVRKEPDQTWRATTINALPVPGEFESRQEAAEALWEAT